MKASGKSKNTAKNAVVSGEINASPHTSRYATHDSGTLWIAGPSMVGDFHPLISTGLPAHTV
ncbi:hypothetical protein BUE65_21360, partial [Klebsiella variicola]